MIHIDRLERYWLIAVGIVFGGFAAALLASVFVFGVRLPSPVGRIDPAKIDQTEFATPGLTEEFDGTYTLRIVAKMWSFDLGKDITKEGSIPVIAIPVGSNVTIKATSKDITHGLYLEQHSINVMMLPGQISQVEVKFDRPGKYHIICHEYCGPGHQGMIAAILVQ
jgi:cytochrome c oxidase subunit 2